MRIRLIQPPLVQPLWRQLTIPVIGAEFEAQGMAVEVCDENIDELDESDVDVVGITCHVYNANRAFEISEKFRKRHIPVIFGGTFPTVSPQLVAEHADSVVVGELEGLTAEIVSDLRAGNLKPLYEHKNRPSLEQTVKPDFSLLKNDSYFKFTFPLETSRGCRFNCKFCTTNALYGKPRCRSLSDIERDISQYDHGLIEVIDVNFLNDSSHFKKVLPLLKASSAPGWTGQTTLSDLAAAPELPRLFAASRCRSLFIGLETPSETSLSELNKSWSNPKELRQVVSAFHKEGVLVQAGIIVGLDSDNKESFKEMIEFLQSTGVHAISLTFLHYYPGTQAYELVEKEGRIASTSWAELDGDFPVIVPKNLTIAALKSEVTKLTNQLFSFSAITSRAYRAGLFRHFSQLVHHFTINLSLRDYYQELQSRSAGVRNKANAFAKISTDLVAFMLSFLWSW